MENSAKINVLIIEDHALARFGLKTVLNESPGNFFITEAESGEKGLELSKSLKPDIVIMDLGLPGINGIDATRKIKLVDENIKIIILTSHNSEQEVLNVLHAGAQAYCLKDIKPEKLFQVIEFILEGAFWLDPGVSGSVLKVLKLKKFPTPPSRFESDAESGDKIQLTDREVDVLSLIVDGYTNAEISEKLCVSIHTAKAHVCNILHKLSVDDRTQAAIKALKDKII